MHIFAAPKIEINYTPLLREKGGGVLEGMPLSTSFQKAKELNIPIRSYKPEKGESWIDVMNRGKEFLNNLCENYIFGKSAGISTKKIPIISDPKSEQKEEIKEITKDFSKKLTITGKKPDTKKLGLKVSKSEPEVRILAVSHGGFIMEFVNIIREIKGMGVSEKNSAKNTAIFIFRIECANCKGICKGACKTHKLGIKILAENDNSHLLEKPIKSKSA